MCHICSGETAFMNLTYEFGWARNPMIERVKDLAPTLSMTLIYGSRSWVDYGVGYEVKYRRPDSYVGVEVGFSAVVKLSQCRYYV